MASGTVKFYRDMDSKGGYGFITPDEQPAKDVFVAFTDVAAAGLRKLEDGQKIEYTPAPAKTGQRARQLKVLS